MFQLREDQTQASEGKSREEAKPHEKKAWTNHTTVQRRKSHRRNEKLEEWSTNRKFVSFNF